MAVGSAIIYAVGVPYLALSHRHVRRRRPSRPASSPFLIGDALKAALAMGALPAAWKLVGRRG